MLKFLFTAAKCNSNFTVFQQIFQNKRIKMSKSSYHTEAKLLEKLKNKHLAKNEKIKQGKELMKALETPAEKRQRRIQKKQDKERKRKEKMGWDENYMTYTNSDNPFGDSHLLQPFVWGKKLEKEGLQEISREQLELKNRHKHEENRIELESVKKRRQERELMRQQREEEAALEQRGKEAAHLAQWHKQENQFHLKQAKLRAHIRIQDNRAKPIDFLIQYIDPEDENHETKMYEPYSYLQGLQVKDLDDLLANVKIFIVEDKSNFNFWQDMIIIIEDELSKIKKMIQPECQKGRREEISRNVMPDVTNVIKGKTASELERLQTRIEEKISGRAEGVDIGYWETLLSQLKAHMARARLRDMHKENLQKKLTLLKAEQNVCKTENDMDASSKMQIDQDPSESADMNDSSEECELEDDVLGCYSPKYIKQSELEADIFFVLEEDDMKRLELARDQVLKLQNTDLNVYSAREQAMKKEVSKNMEAGEAEFSVESHLGDQDYLWSDKYRPRKPRYFNRVHTGFEWNRYNRTHYDLDNPPPKIVQGYKFNIFYPDLLDKNSTPEYFLTACPENEDFSIIRFKAGPPYEDLAFKIVNREWEHSYKRGFRCQFHNNIFQLWFHFKRYRYRR